MFRPLTHEQADIVNKELKRQTAYLRRLAKRIELKSPPVHVQKWADQAAWAVDGFQYHFAVWARGDEPRGIGMGK